jgi:hypothetical protein
MAMFPPTFKVPPAREIKQSRESPAPSVMLTDETVNVPSAIFIYLLILFDPEAFIVRAPETVRLLLAEKLIPVLLAPALIDSEPIGFTGEIFRLTIVLLIMVTAPAPAEAPG